MYGKMMPEHPQQGGGLQPGPRCTPAVGRKATDICSEPSQALAILIRKNKKNNVFKKKVWEVGAGRALARPGGTHF